VRTALVCAGLLLSCVSCRVAEPAAVPAPQQGQKLDCDLIFPAPSRDLLAP
jgi:hypothetical protein